MSALLVLQGPPEGKVLPLHVDPFRIGRNPDCDLCVPVNFASREHARIVRDAGRFFIEDSGSRNGTLLNDQLLQARAELTNDDQVQIADTLVCFLDVACFSDGVLQARFEDRWRTPTVLSIALAAYQEQPLPLGLLDPDRLAVLSDALEEDGCTERAVLEHLRSSVPHVRACWVRSLILGKG